MFDYLCRLIFMLVFVFVPACGGNSNADGAIPGDTDSLDEAHDTSGDAVDDDDLGHNSRADEGDSDNGDTDFPEDTDSSDDTDSEEEPPCEDGQKRDISCGFNGRGLKRQTCEEGIWVSLPCVDPDICTDGDTKDEGCGVMGTMEITCVEGRWKAGECVDEYENPGDEIPAESKGSFLYFSGKKLNDKYNSDLYMIDMTLPEPELVQVTDTASIDESSPAVPEDISFMVYGNGGYGDHSLSTLRWVELDGDGMPDMQTDKLLIGRESESCIAGTYYFGKGTPAVSLDGKEIVFVDTYKAGEDIEGCPEMAYGLATASLDSKGNAGSATALPWDEGVDPSFMVSKPMSPIYLEDTKRVAVAVFGLDQHPVSTEIAICEETCSDLGDWDWLTYLAIWSDGNVAQRCLASNPVSDEIGFYRLSSIEGFDTGIYTSSGISGAAYDSVYGAYGVLDVEERFVSSFAGENLAASHRPLAFSPDGKLLAVSVTYVDNQIMDERHSELAVIDKETGVVYKKFDFRGELREVDGLMWR